MCFIKLKVFLGLGLRISFVFDLRNYLFVVGYCLLFVV